MRFLAEFLLDSDLCLPSDAQPLEFSDPGGTFTLTISNTENTEHSREGVLLARMLFGAEALAEARSLAEKNLARSLNALTYTTGREFKYNLLRFIMDWTPGVQIRDAHYAETPVWDLAETDLAIPYIVTAQHFMGVQGDDRVQTALRWYRLGIGASVPED
jgi:hypothetical protein